MTLLIGNLDTYYEHLDDERRRSIIRDIRSQTRTLNELVENILEIARIDGKQNTLQYRTVDLAYIAREETEKQMPLAQKKGHQIQVIGVNYLPVLGHEGQLRQIIRNLLNNAIKYTPDGGRIICECRAYTAPDNPSTDALQEKAWPGRAELAAGNWAMLRVSDSGIGIAPEEISHVFERFYRVRSQDNISGTGLGLSIAQELVEAHGGKITASSNLHEGSIFVVYLPLVEEV
jgi:signal transduction histidine kinase